MRAYVLMGLVLAFGLAGSGSAFDLNLHTAGGDTVFYAPPGDTVEVLARVDSEGQRLTGVELFLQFDPRLFGLADGAAPAEPAGLLGDVLVDTLLSVSDSLALVHYAEADLEGKVVDGALFSLRFVVLRRYSGRSPVGVYADRTERRKSAFTVPGTEGATVEVTGVAPLVYRDDPPRLSLPEAFDTVEDSAIVISLGPLATDPESGEAKLRWEVSGPDSLVDVTFDADSSAVRLAPVADWFGSIPIVFAVADSVGGVSAEQVELRVASVNDPPEMLRGAFPDTVFLRELSVLLELDGTAVDADGQLLVWYVEGRGGVMAGLESWSVARISAPVDWIGEGSLLVRVTDASGTADSLTVPVARPSALVETPGDIDGNGSVGFEDFIVFVRHYGTMEGDGGYLRQVDLNGDGRIDFPDFIIFSRLYGM